MTVSVSLAYTCGTVAANIAALCLTLCKSGRLQDIRRLSTAGLQRENTNCGRVATAYHWGQPGQDLHSLTQRYSAKLQSTEYLFASKWPIRISFVLHEREWVRPTISELVPVRPSVRSSVKQKSNSHFHTQEWSFINSLTPAVAIWVVAQL